MKRRWIVLCVLLVGTLMGAVRVYSAPSETEDESYYGMFIDASLLDEKPLIYVSESAVTEDVYVIEAINHLGQDVRVNNQTAFRPLYDLLRSHAYNVEFQGSYYYISVGFVEPELKHKGTFIGPAPPPLS